jgi:hypothetical protein
MEEEADMTHRDTQGWEDIIPRGKTSETAGPFGVAGPVDGYAFTDQPESPELRYRPQPQAEVPAPPRREPPRRIRDQVPVTGVWQPGGSARTEQPPLRTPRPNVVTTLLSALIPLALLAGGVYLVMRLYQ